MVFDSTHPHHIKVLPGCARVAIPSIIGDIDQHLGPHLRKLAHLIGKDGLVADESSIGMAIGGEDGTLLAGIEEANLGEETLGEEEEVLIGDVLAKWDEMHLVVTANELALR